MERGRPLKFESPKAMQKLIDKYFAETPDEELTITGLALALDTDRQTLINYEKRDDFFDTIKRAKTVVENSYERALRKNGRTGEIFALKNFGWADKQEIDSNLNVSKLDSNLENLSIEELKKLADKK